MLRRLTTRSSPPPCCCQRCKFVAASPRIDAGSAKRKTRGAAPASRKRRATTKPSPPLFPFPQKTTMLRVARSGKVSLQIIRHGRAGVLHQLQAGNAVALGGQPVGLAHLFRGKHFHGIRSWHDPSRSQKNQMAATHPHFFDKSVIPWQFLARPFFASAHSARL